MDRWRTPLSEEVRLETTWHNICSMGQGDEIVRAFSQLAARRPADVIVTSPTDHATCSDIDRLSRAVAAQVAAAPIEPGSLVGLAAPNGPAFLAGFLAIVRAGHAVLLLDHQAPDEDRRRVTAVMGASGVLECREAWPASPDGFRCGTLAPPGTRTPARDMAVVKLTSGSTGAARGVAMTAQSLMADESALFETMGLCENDRLLAALPLSHSYGLTTLVLSSLVRGLTLVLPEGQGPFAALSAARQLEATVFPTVPAYIQALLKMSQPPALPGVVRLVMSAGAMLPSATAAQFRHTYGQPVHAFYGSSECGGICFDREGGAAERGTVGTPVNGVRLMLTPLEESGDADEGLVVVESASVGARYLPEPDSRLEAGRFETPDVGAWRGGELVLLRRADRVINVRGRKVDPSEVERVLAALQGVEEAVVFGVATPDRRDEIVRAVIACPSGRLGYEEVAAWCRTRLADHKVPRSIVIVAAIPYTERGKIDRAALLNHNG